MAKVAPANSANQGECEKRPGLGHGSDQARGSVLWTTANCHPSPANFDGPAANFRRLPAHFDPAPLYFDPAPIYFD